ncbi:MAG: radical SAM protein [Elusimicrobiota bacterium]
MKILLISPVIDPKIKTPTGLMIPQLSLHLLEGLTPAQHEVKIIEEEMEDIDLNEECDLVGISCMTANAPRAYYLAKEFKKRGRKVILGGVHPTLLFDEAIQYADSVIVGEVENVWEQALKDFQEGNLQKKYHHDATPLDRYIPTKYKKHKDSNFFDCIPVMTTRGCPYNCDFCCVSNLYGSKIRHAPIENVVRTIKESKRKYVIFLDDNIIGDTQYSKLLFKAIIPLKIKWAGQASLSFVNDIELMKLAAKSGCVALFFGVESVSETQLKKCTNLLKK